MYILVMKVAIEVSIDIEYRRRGESLFLED